MRNYFSNRGRNSRAGGKESRYFRPKSMLKPTRFEAKRKEYRRPDETIQMSPSLEASLWFEENDVQWSLAWFDENGQMHKTFGPEHALELLEFAIGLANTLSICPGVSPETASDLTAFAAKLDSPTGERQINGNGHGASALAA